MSELDIDIWSDVMCPWCAIGYANLAQAIALLDGELDVRIRWMPFELVPDMPPEGRSQKAHYELATGKSFSEAQESRSRVAEAARAAGYPIAWNEDADGERMVWNTFDCHKLLRWAYAWKGSEVQTALKQALFDAHFREHRNISDRDVLCEIAGSISELWAEGALEALEDHTLEMAVRIEEQRGRKSGIATVPTLVVGGKYVLEGSQEPEQYAAALRQIASLLSDAQEHPAAT